MSERKRKRRDRRMWRSKESGRKESRERVGKERRRETEKKERETERMSRCTSKFFFDVDVCLRLFFCFT